MCWFVRLCRNSSREGTRLLVCIWLAKVARYVASDPGTWQSIEQRVGGLNTGGALTDRKQKFTIVNGMIYSPLFSCAGYVQKTAQRILRHEPGHIICNSSSEDVADRYANTGACHKETNRRT